MRTEPADSLHFSSASSLECAAALDLLLSHLPLEARTVQVLQFTQAAANAAPLPGLWTAKRQDAIVAATWIQANDGSSAAVWPPRTVQGEPTETAVALLKWAMSAVDPAEKLFLQALCDTAAANDADLLIRAGFKHLTDLAYLVCEQKAFAAAEPASPLQFEALQHPDEERLVRLLEKTYVDTQDCPQLNGLRSTEDVLRGYRAIGSFDLSRWLVAVRQGVDVGCLLLADHPLENQWELVYLGVVPEARGQRLGSVLVEQAQWLANCAGRARLVLAVSTDNRPALSMYFRAGFVSWADRGVFVRFHRR